MPRKAALGFEYLGLPGELQVTSHEELQQKRENRAILSHQREKARKLRCYHNNKERYNAQKRAVARSIAGRYKEAKRKAKLKGEAWEFSRKEWERAWQDAGFVRIPGSQSVQNPNGVVVPAYGIRGAHMYNNTCMARIDTHKPWGVDNYKIMYRGEELRPGHPYFAGYGS